MGIPVAVLTRARRAAGGFHALTGVSVDPAELLTGRCALTLSGGGELIELSMAAVAATYAQDDRTHETHCTATPAPSPPACDLGVDNATVERLLAERRLASC